MGAGASVPDEVTFEQARSLAGDKWEDKLTTFWPEVDGAAAEKITKEQLLSIIKDIPSFATKISHEDRLNWDEKVIKGADNNGEGFEDMPLPPDATGGGPSTKREKVVTEKREALDMEAKRMEALAKENGLAAAEVREMKAGKMKPVRPPRHSRKPGDKQSTELRALIRQQKKAAKMSGRPPSRSIEDMEFVVEAKPRNHVKQAAPEVMTFGDDPAEPAIAEPQSVEEADILDCKR